MCLHCEKRQGINAINTAENERAEKSKLVGKKEAGKGENTLVARWQEGGNCVGNGIQGEMSYPCMFLWVPKQTTRTPFAWGKAVGGREGRKSLRQEKERNRKRGKAMGFFREGKEEKAEEGEGEIIYLISPTC